MHNTKKHPLQFICSELAAGTFYLFWCISHVLTQNASTITTLKAVSRLKSDAYLMLWCKTHQLSQCRKLSAGLNLMHISCFDAERINNHTSESCQSSKIWCISHVLTQNASIITMPEAVSRLKSDAYAGFCTEKHQNHSPKSAKESILTLLWSSAACHYAQWLL